MLRIPQTHVRLGLVRGIWQSRRELDLDKPFRPESLLVVGELVEDGGATESENLFAP